MSGAAANPARPDGIGADGTSVNWTRRKNDIERQIDEFLLSEIARDVLKLQPPWSKLAASTLIDPLFYQHFAANRVDVTIPEGRKNAGSHFAAGSVVTTLNGAVRAAYNKLSKPPGLTPEAMDFFKCLDENSSSAPAKWLRGVRYNTKRAVFSRSVDDGEEQDQSPTPLYLERGEQGEHACIKDIMRALAVAGTPEAADRANAIISA